jgi:DNA-binding PadR family transcriptional regulator
MGREKRSADGFLGEFEQMLLLAILQAGDEAFAGTILRELDGRAGRRTDRGAMYKTLDRLESKGFIAWSVEPGTPARGGRRRRLFKVLPAGVAALRTSRRALLRLWEGLDPVLADPTQ